MRAGATHGGLVKWLPRPAYLITALVGGLGIGALVAVEPYVRGTLELTIKEYNLLDLFPYQLLLLILGAAMALLVVPYVGDNRIERFIVFLLFLPPHFRGLTVITGPAVTVLALAFLLERRFYYRDTSWNPTPVYILALATVPMNFVSVSVVGGAVGWVREGTIESLHVILLFILINAIITRERLKSCFRYLVGIGVFSSIVAIVTFLLYMFTGFGISTASSEYRMGETPWGVTMRATAFAGHPNSLAILLGAPAVMLLYLALSPLALSRRQRLVLLGVTGVFLLAIYTTLSRGSWVGIAAAIAVMPFFRKPSWWPFFLAVIAIAISVGLTTGMLQQGVSSFYASFVEQRAEAVECRMYYIWRGVGILKRYPLTGIGLGAFGRYNPDPAAVGIHNLEMQLATEVGIPGALIHMGLMILVTVRAFLAMLSARSTEGRTIMQMVLLALVMTLVHGQFDILAFTYHIWFVLGMAEAATLCIRRSEAVGAGPSFAR